MQSHFAPTVARKFTLSALPEICTAILPSCLFTDLGLKEKVEPRHSLSTWHDWLVCLSFFGRDRTRSPTASCRDLVTEKLWTGGVSMNTKQRGNFLATVTGFVVTVGRWSREGVAETDD